MWVARRSRKKRSWEMTTAQPGKSSSAASSAPKRLDVEVVRRLVEEEQVAALLQHLGEMHAVALAARKLADLLLLVGALEVEPAAIGAAGHLPLVAELHVVEAARDLLPDGLLGVEVRRGSGRRSTSFTVSPSRIAPASGFSLPVIILNSVVLPAPFGPMTPTMPPGGSLKSRSSISELVAEGLLDEALDLDAPRRRAAARSAI